MAQEMKQHYYQLSDLLAKRLAQVEELEKTLDETFKEIYGFSIDADLIVTQEFLDFDPDCLKPLDSETYILFPNLESDTFTVLGWNGISIPDVPLSIVKGMLK